MPGLLSIADAGGPSINPKLARVYMIPVKDDDSGFDDGKERAFQYWPESLQDSRGDTGWQEKVVPGGSHPLLQWTQCGGRRVSFTVVFGRDRCELPDPADPRTDEIDLEENVDVAAAVAWLRYYTYPLYKDDDFRVIAPPKILLVFPGTALGWAAGGWADGLLCVMTSCDVTYTAWFPNGTPRLVEVSLEFAEIVQLGGRVAFHGRDMLENTFEQYPMRKQDY